VDRSRVAIRLRSQWLTAIGLFPASRMKNLLLSIPAGVSVSSDARIGPVLLLKVRLLEVGPGASIAFGNVFRGLDLLRLANSATIGSWNWVVAAAAFAPYNAELGEGALVLGSSAAITSRHYLDCTGGITLGRMTTVAGVRSTWFTHRINLRESSQFSAGTHVGDYCFTASGVQVGPGVTIADGSVVAMGSVVVSSLSQKGRMYGGVPARDLGAANNSAYVRRAVGHVDRRR
jgi:acetyltransferase-like isoleucine patch superfamily enzyme